jgi:hypothetical protein
MDAPAPDPVSRIQFQPFVDLARQACSRWGVAVPADEGSVHDTALALREALKRAASAAADGEAAQTYAGDAPGLVGSLPGVTLDGLVSDVEAGGNQGDEWGICFRVVAGDVAFDVPLVFGIDEDSATSILAEIDGREHEFVSIDDIAEMAKADSVEIRAHADSWSHLKRSAKDLAVDLPTALAYRRPGAWDVFRGEMTGMLPRSLPLWSEDDFQSRFLLSIRYDMDAMAESREMLRLYSLWSPEPFSAEWSSWFPQITDLLHAIGAPRPISGLSVLLHFSVEEPNGYDWEAVNARNVVVACGLDPVQAHALLEYVNMDAAPFYDLPETEEKRFVLLAASVVPDALLASVRASSSGRSDAYDRLATAMAERTAEPEPA